MISMETVSNQQAQLLLSTAVLQTWVHPQSKQVNRNSSRAVNVARRKEQLELFTEWDWQPAEILSFILY